MRDVETALASDDAAVVVGAIERAAALIRDDTLRASDASALGRTVAALARHARSNVRGAVARAALHLPEDAFEAVMTALLSDPNRYVKHAATQSYDDRCRRRRAARVQEEASADMRELRARLADAYGKRAARDAERLRDLALEQFVERLHHELAKVATPLRLEMIDLVDDARRERAEALATRAAKAKSMLDVLVGITTAARAHASVIAPAFRDEDLRALVLEHVALLTARVDEEARARLRVEVAIDEGLTVEIDRNLYGQALSNLLQNAAEAYAKEGGGEIRVRVTAERREAATLVALVVEDRGRGIPDALLAQLGEPFVSTKGGGRGLGMLNVWKMIEGVHGGTVGIQSKVDVGTKVTAVVPRRQ